MSGKGEARGRGGSGIPERSATRQGRNPEKPRRDALLSALAEARAEQAATADILAAISGSKAEIGTILVRLIHVAIEFCSAKRGVIWLEQGGRLVLGAHVGYPSEWLAHVQANPVAPGPDADTVGGRAAWTGEVYNVADLPEDPRFSAHAAHRVGDDRGCLAAPLVSDGAVVGVILLTRSQPGLFTERQVELIRRFSNQAVIAVQNARLFNETQEALQGQAATSEVLQIISKSPTDAQPVFDRIVEAARRLLKCEKAVVLLCEGKSFYAVSAMTAEGLVTEFSHKRLPIDTEHNFPSWAIVQKKVVYLPDWSLMVVPKHERRVQANLNIKSSLYLPLMRADECIGVLALVGDRPHHFGDKAIAQTEAFRDQALIAIENARLFAETQEALEQLRASASILSVISNSVSNAKPVFERILQSCQHLFGGDELDVLLVDDEGQLTIAAYLGKFYDLVAPTFPAPVERTPAGRAIRERRPVHWPDLAHGDDVPGILRKMAKLTGYRSMTFAPLILGDRGIGAIGVARSTGPFQPKELAMLQTFADQAVIAIENARLFNETKEALEHQTATAEVLKVISRSVSDATPVFETIMQACQRLFGLAAVAVYLVDGDLVRGVAHRGWSEGDWGRDVTPLAGSTTGLAIAERRTIHFPDLADKPDLPDRFKAPIREAGGLTIVYAPMLWEDRGVGSLVLSRRPAKPFSDKEIKLVQSFADQAAIAIQNARLFEEVRAKTRDLEESLQQQTATADVLKVISRSAFNLDLASSTILEAAARLCHASMSTLHLRDGNICRLATQLGMSEAFERLAREAPIPIKYPLHSRRAARAGEVAHFADAWTDPDYLYTATAKLAGYRAIVVVPLMREGDLIGIFSLARPDPEPFTESQIKLILTFADQAAIAIENARLFKETDEALEQQTATTDVLKIISRSAFDLQPVFETVAESAVRLCDAERAVIFQYDGQLLRGVAAHNVGPELWEFIAQHPVAPGMNSISARAALFRKAVRVDDVQSDPDYSYAPRDVDLIRSMASVPMIKGDKIVGTITIYKLEVKPFTDRQISLVETFAEQAVIAIENVRLFDEVQARTQQLATSLEELRATQDRLVQTEKLASLGQLTAGIAHEIKNPLNFVNNFSSLSVELVDELQEVLAPVALADDVRSEVEEISQLLKGNLEKVTSHGRRADSIVRNMLLHSRTGAGERRLVDVNGLVEESLNLAYHGARAETAGFNVTLERDYDGGTGEAELLPQEVTRVLLNLIGNGFYAVRKRVESAGSGYEPRLTVTTRNLGHAVEIRVRDNGTGIPDEVKQKMFDPFYTTKPAGEGTGLGLSLSHDIVVKQHDGRIAVETVPGAFTEFTITLPRSAAAGMHGGSA